MCGACERGSWDYCLPMSQGSTAFLRQAWHIPFALSTRLKASGQVRKEVEDIVETYTRTVVGKTVAGESVVSCGTVTCTVSSCSEALMAGGGMRHGWGDHSS